MHFRSLRRGQRSVDHGLRFREDSAQMIDAPQLLPGVAGVIIVVFGLFPGIVTDWLTNPAAKALANQAIYIKHIMGAIP